MPIELQETAHGVLLPVHAQPGARRNEICGVHDGRLKVAVTQVAEKGKANKELLKLLAGELDIRRSQLKLVVGEASSRKVVQISDVTKLALEQKLLRWLDGQPD